MYNPCIEYVQFFWFTHDIRNVEVEGLIDEDTND